MKEEIQEEFDFEDDVSPGKAVPKKKDTVDEFDDSDDEPKPSIVVKENISDKDNTDRWRNRRAMAWISLISILVMTLMLFFIVDVDKVEKLENIAIWIGMSLTSIIGFYMGATTYVDVKGFKK